MWHKKPAFSAEWSLFDKSIIRIMTANKTNGNMYLKLLLWPDWEAFRV